MAPHRALLRTSSSSPPLLPPPPLLFPASLVVATSPRGCSAVVTRPPNLREVAPAGFLFFLGGVGRFDGVGVGGGDGGGNGDDDDDDDDEAGAMTTRLALALQRCPPGTANAEAGSAERRKPSKITFDTVAAVECFPLSCGKRSGVIVDFVMGGVNSGALV